MVIMEENQLYGDVIGSVDAPYLTRLAHQFGSATAMDAGYPASCPSLAAYIILTSGSDHGICDDNSPAAHPLTGDNLFHQVAASGRQWRTYSESMPTTCDPTNDGLYLVRHTAAPYYVSERARCAHWDVPLGTATAGALHSDVRGGRLPAFSLVAPNACNDMHGASACEDGLVRRGDAWLTSWIPQILSGPDYTSGRLAVVITWDEGSESDNHIPTLVLAPATHQVAARTHWTHCSTLRTIEDVLHLSPLGCAASAPNSMITSFAL
jgi:hypothetical protein